MLSELAMLKYVHVLLCSAQCDSVNAQSRACSAGIFLIGGAGGAGATAHCPRRLDKDAVCAPLLGAFVVACVHSADLPREGGVSV